MNRTSRQVEQLVARVADDDSPITYANGLDVALNGSIYFTASTDVLPARSPDGSYDTGFAWLLSNFRGLPRWVMQYQALVGAFQVVSGIDQL